MAFIETIRQREQSLTPPAREFPIASIIKVCHEVEIQNSSIKVKFSNPELIRVVGGLVSRLEEELEKIDS